MRVAAEAVPLEERTQRRHLSLVVHVLREDVLVGWLARRAVDEERRPFAVRPGPLAEELEAGVPAELLEHAARPVHRPFRVRREAVWVEQYRLIVIAENHQREVHAAL